MKISPARAAAFDVLLKIETAGAFSSVLLPGYERNLSQKDRSLCHELTLGALRRQIYLDRIIDELAKRRKLDAEVRVALRIGLYQLLYLDRIPDYSAIYESVGLVQRARKGSAKGLVNAVLRGFARAPVVLEYPDEIERLSVESSHPRWLIEKWISDFSMEEAGELVAANNRAPRPAFRVTARGRASLPNLGGEVEKSAVVEGGFLVNKGDEGLNEAARKGQIYFQDEGSQMVGAAASAYPSDKILDVCAAPGSKTTQIAANLAEPKGVLIAAGDVRWSRVEFLRDNCRLQGVGFVNVLQYDAEYSLPLAEEAFDAVLVDAPCSGTGTIRSNPEIRYFLKPEDFAELSSKQLRILKNASKTVRRGGRLLYSTCSLESEENEQVVRRFLKDSGRFRVIPPFVPERFFTPDGFARTFPHRDSMDGFFIAAFERAS